MRDSPREIPENFLFLGLLVGLVPDIINKVGGVGRTSGNSLVARLRLQ
jgi:hypothetical protein